MIVAYAYQFVEGENAGDADIVAQRVDPDGKLLRNEGTKSVDVAATDKLEPNPCAVVIGAR
ncbi:MAG: hypothetical protein FJX75_15240 [Armatimonadetes bacterium]|nr:hypothetical protein [Armatimonadota bacterium]